MSLIGVAIGLRMAKQSASISSGYAAAYLNPIVLVITLAFLLLGLPLIIYWRTRWIGLGLIAAGILNLAAFGGGMENSFDGKSSRLAPPTPNGFDRFRIRNFRR